jgi:hypothetical protein
VAKNKKDKKDGQHHGNTGGEAQTEEATVDDPTHGAAQTEEAKVERPRCPTCGRRLPKPKPINPEKLAAKKKAAEEKMVKLKAQMAALEEKQERYDDQLSQLPDAE